MTGGWGCFHRWRMVLTVVWVLTTRAPTPHGTIYISIPGSRYRLRSCTLRTRSIISSSSAQAVRLLQVEGVLRLLAGWSCGVNRASMFQRPAARTLIDLLEAHIHKYLANLKARVRECFFLGIAGRRTHVILADGHLPPLARLDELRGKLGDLLLDLQPSPPAPAQVGHLQRAVDDQALTTRSGGTGRRWWPCQPVLGVSPSRAAKCARRPSPARASCARCR